MASSFLCAFLVSVTLPFLLIIIILFSSVAKPQPANETSFATIMSARAFFSLSSALFIRVAFETEYSALNPTRKMSFFRALILSRIFIVGFRERVRFLSVGCFCFEGSSVKSETDAVWMRMSVSFRLDFTASYMSLVVFTCIVFVVLSFGSLFAIISVTCAPRSCAACARQMPVFPEPGFVMILTGSMYSIVGPAVISIFLSFRSFFLKVLMIAFAMHGVGFRRALFSFMSGSMKVMPCFSRVSMFFLIMGFVYIDSCMAGTIMMGIFEPRAVAAKVVTVVSSIPCAIFEIVLDVAGAIRRRSAFLSCLPQYCTCSILPVSRVMQGFPVAHSIRLGWIIFFALVVITGIISAPFRMRVRASSGDFTAATEPVMHRIIVFSDSSVLSLAIIDFEVWSSIVYTYCRVSFKILRGNLSVCCIDCTGRSFFRS